MSLTSLVQNIILETELPTWESMQDILLDTQEFALELLVEKAVPQLTPEDIVELDQLISQDKSVDKIDNWIQTKITDYQSYMLEIEQHIKEYLIPESEDGVDELENDLEE